MSIAINLEIFKNVLIGIAEEMGANLQRSAYSPNIKERRDFSCALFDREGRLAAQAAHIPVHLGSMPLLIREIIDSYDISPGDMIIANDPFSGGTHLPDITLVEPIYDRKRLWGFAASRAHHSDVGGMSAGSMPDSREIFQEGIIIPPMFLKKKFRLNRELMALITLNTRTPRERMGDLYAQIASLDTAKNRVRHLVRKYGFEESLDMVGKLINYSEKLTRIEIQKLADGNYHESDVMEDDHTGDLVAIRAMIIINGDEILVDFAGTSSQRRVSFNAPLPVTMAAVYYSFRCLLGDHIPPNEGCFRPIQVRAPEGCLVNAMKPCAVSAGNVETSQRIVDIIFKALAPVLPDRIPAASCGSMNNVAIGGGNFAYYETIAGGMGARPGKDGISAVHTHMTNTRNTPVEAIEVNYPFIISRYEIREGSGGDGDFRGGDGIIREYLFRSPAEVSIISERRKVPPYGLSGGKPGRVGENYHFNSREGKEKKLPGKITLEVGTGDRIRVETPGGGGYGGSEEESKKKKTGDRGFMNLLGDAISILKRD
ncbi:MAG: hydantoinase B/oxoprolinase family protein [Candidatus Eremiobacteraeota bacterium]|nr:hydantoinase B/oxoprolinase family protein [Candidatus Eremiobacteraeota bacterium]